MRIAIIPIAAFLALVLSSAAIQAPPQTALIVNRMSGAYRSLQSFQDSVSITRKIGQREFAAKLTLASQRPNKYLLELKGEYLNTIVASDGTTLLAIRPDRKAYTKAKAPLLLTKGDFLSGVDMPAMGARIITQLLTATAREGEIGNLLNNAKVAGPQGFGNKLAYLLTGHLAEGAEVRIYVTSDDYLVRRVVVLNEGSTIWQENHETIQLDKEIPSDFFTKSLPDAARIVASLPPLEKPEDVAAIEDEKNPLPEDDSESALKAKITRGKGVYQGAGCNRCHSIAGRGGQVGPDLSQEGGDPSRTVEWIAAHIKNPKTHSPGSSMPSFAQRITERNIQALAAYLASMK